MNRPYHFLYNEHRQCPKASQPFIDGIFTCVGVYKSLQTTLMGPVHPLTTREVGKGYMKLESVINQMILKSLPCYVSLIPEPYAEM